MLYPLPVNLCPGHDMMKSTVVGVRLPATVLYWFYPLLFDILTCLA